MSEMQKKILGAIQTVAESNGYEFTRKGHFSNTGTIYISPQGTFRNTLNFYYNFQDGQFTLQFCPGSIEPVGTCGFTHHSCIRNDYVPYSDAGKIEAMLEFVRSKLPKVKTPRAKKKAKDDLKPELRKLLTAYARAAGTDTAGAIRDCMTDLIAICGDSGCNAEERFQAAFDVFDEEASLARG